MSLYLSLSRKQNTRVGILCWPLLEEVYCAHIHVSSLGETCWKPVNTLFELKYLRLHCLVVGNLNNDDRDHQTASGPAVLVSFLVLGILLVLWHPGFHVSGIKLLPWKKNVVNLKTISCHMLNPPHIDDCLTWVGEQNVFYVQIWLFLGFVLASFIYLFF